MDQSNNQPSKSYFSLLNENLSHRYKSSLNSSSNITSNLLLEEAWQANSQTLNNRIDGIVVSAKQLVKNSNPLNVTSWTSSLSYMPDPISVFERSLQSCKCSQETSTTYSNTDFMNDCICENDSPNVQTQTLELTSSQNSSHESKEENNKLFKPKFRNSKPSKTTLNKFIPLSSKKSSTSKEYDIEMDESKAYKGNSKNRYSALNREYDIEVDEPKAYKGNSRYKYCAVNKEYDIEVDNPKAAKTSRDVDMEDEEKAHKSHVAKITFKTAKEQLLASNPAARRTLGASRKAQAKFVSPMLGALEKQESAEPVITDERLKHIDPKMIELIESEIIDKGTPIGWDDIAGLQMAKSVIQEAVVWPLLRPDIFTGLRRPPRGILLFGPPGTGKTLIGKCVAAQCRATFFSISASSLTSKWIGDGEKMVRALFAVARCHQPAVIFIDEIDSLLTQRNDTEHEATRRIKTEFLVQFDGAATGEEDRLLIVGATNRPQELDEAARRRLVKRLYIPLPDTEARKQIISNLLKDENHDLAAQSVTEIAGLTDGYSGADMKSLCSEAAMGPIRSVPLSQIATIDRNQVRPVNVQDFKAALQRVRPSVSQDDLGQYVKWNNTYGQGF